MEKTEASSLYYPNLTQLAFELLEGKTKRIKVAPLSFSWQLFWDKTTENNRFVPMYSKCDLREQLALSGVPEDTRPPVV